MTWNNKINAIEIIQNNQEFLFGTFEIRQVRQFTKYTEHLIVGFEEVEESDQIYETSKEIRPRYNPEIQRKVNNAKVERIADFLLTDPKAMFPTNIVIAIPEEVIDDIERNQKNIIITLNNAVNKEIKKENGAVYLTIIDGQHRIRGIERAITRLNDEIASLSKILRTANENDHIDLSKKLTINAKKLDRLLKFELLVTFFVGIPLEYQAMIFATINKTQTKVPENLVYSLFGITKNDSPQKTSLEVVLALNGIEKSPFYNRIRLVGGRYEKGKLIPLSQANMVKSILKNISNNNREEETDRFKKRIQLQDNPKNLAFRKYYANNEDHKIVRSLYSFFSAVKESFVDNKGESLWVLPESGKITNVLQTNVGYQALLKVLFYLFNIIPEADRDNKEIYKTYLGEAKSLDFLDQGMEKRYPYTSKTINILYDDIVNKIKNKEFKT